MEPKKRDAVLKIGEFSRLARVSVKALRHYDRIGLLRPTRTDSLTGYRYYSDEQVTRARRLIKLKRLGFTLEQVSTLLNSDLSDERIRVMLESRREELRSDLGSHSERLEGVETWLRELKRGGAEQQPEGGVVLKSVGPLRVASIRAVLPTYDHVEDLLDLLDSYRERNGVSAGDWLAVFYEEQYREREVFCEAVFVTDDPIPEDDRVREGELPAVERMACATHHGPYSTIERTYEALLGWIAENGYRIDGPNRELYAASHEERDGYDQLTELQFPVYEVSGREKSLDERSPERSHL